MKESKQDEYYLKKEGNSYFQRNISKTDTPEIRDSKKIIFDEVNIKSTPTTSPNKRFTTPPKPQAFAKKDKETLQ